MAKPYQHATKICLGLTFLAVIGVLWGLNTSNPLITLIFLLPTILYEVYRTEGASTKSASWGLLIVYILEILFILSNISFDLASFLEIEQQYIGGHAVPLGDIKVVAPTIMAALSVVLFARTRGRYTKWLAIIIFASSFAIVYSLDPTVFTRLVKIGVKEGLNKIQY
jgi:hypothetical protein